MISRARSNMEKLPSELDDACLQVAGSTGWASGGAELFDDLFGKFRWRCGRIGALIFEVHCLPFEGTHLMEKRYLMIHFTLFKGASNWVMPSTLLGLSGWPGHQRQLQPMGACQFTQGALQPEVEASGCVLVTVAKGNWI